MCRGRETALRAGHGCERGPWRRIGPVETHGDCGPGHAPSWVWSSWCVKSDVMHGRSQCGQHGRQAMRRWSGGDLCVAPGRAGGHPEGQRHHPGLRGRPPGQDGEEVGTGEACAGRSVRRPWRILADKDGNWH